MSKVRYYGFFLIFNVAIVALLNRSCSYDNGKIERYVFLSHGNQIRGTMRGPDCVVGVCLMSV